jgi:predicted DsbA family dithiol-disulfide isomerase
MTLEITRIRIGLPTKLDHVRKAKEIACMGIIGVPALVINGKIKWSGSGPPKETIKGWLMALKQR